MSKNTRRSGSSREEKRWSYLGSSSCCYPSLGAYKGDCSHYTSGETEAQSTVKDDLEKQPPKMSSADPTLSQLPKPSQGNQQPQICSLVLYPGTGYTESFPLQILLLLNYCFSQLALDVLEEKKHTEGAEWKN